MKNEIKYKGLAENIFQRFSSYVKIDTQSSETTGTNPSTKKQFDLAHKVAEDLKKIGLKKVEIDDKCYLYATIEGNQPQKVIPTICFIAHFDTSPDVSGKDVKPILHKNYQGGKIVLPADKNVVIDPAENPALNKCIGNDIITADGTTLLGADDKAGISEIVEAADWIIKNPDFKHGPIRLVFTPDEEIGCGVDHIDLKKVNADYAYTMDGGELGEIEDETWCADKMIVTVTGRNVHPGYAKDKMVSAIRVVSDLVTRIPFEMAPETTEKREGFIHPNSLSGGSVEQCTLNLLLRDFTTEGLAKQKAIVEKACEDVRQKWPKAKVEIENIEQYRNMKYKIDEDPVVLKNAIEAIKEAGIEPINQPIRGGTDGARLCFMGLLTPNVFAGGVSFHSKTEWASLQTMQKSCQVIINILANFAQQAKAK